MKKIGLFLVAGVLMSSCVSSSYMVTDNAVGTKIGVAKLKMFGKDKDISIQKACKKGGITKVGTVEVRTTMFIFPFVKTIVTGE